MIRYVLLLFVLSSATVRSQAQNPILTGKVVASLLELDNIYVINTRTEKAVQTKTGGYFQITAVAGDTLMFSSTQIIGKRIVLTADDLKKELLFVAIAAKFNELDEVIVFQHKPITAESLGIVPKGQKKFTQAERKLNTASNSYAVAGLNSAAGLDPVFNWMSGRTAMLKKEAEVEKKEGWLEVLSDMFASKYITDDLKIPTDYVNGFMRYCVENSQFVALLQARNKHMAKFLLGDLAVRYNEIIAAEND